jgi:hypothetical protein
MQYTESENALPSPIKSNSLRDWAITYALAGFKVFPLKRSKKKPLGFLVPEGFKHATDDTRHVDTWWKVSPNANIGICLPPNIAVVDIDPKNGGVRTEAMVPTLEVISGGGGLHLYYRDPPPNIGKKDLGDGIEIFTSTNGYLAAPPSIHPDTGLQYKWDGKFDLGRIQLWPTGLVPIQKKHLAPRSNGHFYPALTPSQVDWCMARINPNVDEPKWWTVRSALKMDYPDEGFGRWFFPWSAKATNGKFKGEADCLAKWNRPDRVDGDVVTTLTLMYMAQEQSKEKMPKSLPTEDFQVDIFDETPREKPAAKKPKSKITFRHLADIVAEKREPEWLLLDVLEANVLAVLVGPRGSFKSFIAFDWAMRIAMAGEGVVILSGEGAGIDRRADAWMRTYGQRKNLKELNIIVYEGILKLNKKAILAELATSIANLNFPVRLLLIDTLSKYSPGLNENDNSEVAAFLSGLAVELRDAFKQTVLLVAHTGHEHKDRIRGAYTLAANPDAEYVVKRPDPKGMIVCVTRDRFKDTPSLPPLQYMASSVNLEREDKYGRPIASLILEPDGSPIVTVPAKKVRLGGNQKIVLQVIQECGGNLDAVTEKEVINKAAPRIESAKPRQQVKQALEGLVKRKAITWENGFIRIIKP